MKTLDLNTSDLLALTSILKKAVKLNSLLNTTSGCTSELLEIANEKLEAVLEVEGVAEVNLYTPQILELNDVIYFAIKREEDNNTRKVYEALSNKIKNQLV